MIFAATGGCTSSITDHVMCLCFVLLIALRLPSFFEQDTQRSGVSSRCWCRAAVLVSRTGPDLRSCRTCGRRRAVARSRPLPHPIAGVLRRSAPLSPPVAPGPLRRHHLARPVSDGHRRRPLPSAIPAVAMARLGSATMAAAWPPPPPT